jgi:hypothetical protein
MPYRKNREKFSFQTEPSGIAWAPWYEAPKAAKAQDGGTPGGWPQGKTYTLDDLQVSVSAPVLVGQSKKEYFWAPTIIRLSDKQIVATVGTGPDTFTNESQRSVAIWSNDGGLTWGKPVPLPGSSVASLAQPSGDVVLLPFVLYPRKEGIGADCHVIAKGKEEFKKLKDAVRISGFPRPLDRSEDMAKLGWAGWFFHGKPIQLPDGTYMATVYGFFESAQKKTFKWVGPSYLTADGDVKRYSLAVVESKDGLHWTYRGTVADENCRLKGAEGPCEAALCLLKDGRLMCVFRLEGCLQPAEKNSPYGQSWSNDGGKTWSEPVLIAGNLRSLEPRTEVLAKGTVVLSANRPDILLGFDTGGAGQKWRTLDIVAHHNALVAKDSDRLVRHGKVNRVYGYGAASGTTGITKLDDRSFLFIYDRTSREYFPCWWGGRDPALESNDPSEGNKVWVLRVDITHK